MGAGAINANGAVQLTATAFEAVADATDKVVAATQTIIGKFRQLVCTRLRPSKSERNIWAKHIWAGT